MKKLGLIDADLIVYEAAFCVERKEKDGEYLNWYQVSQIVKTIVRRIFKGMKCTHYMGFLTHGASNFRNTRATTLPYKGQRKTNERKPPFYGEIRDYLQKEFGFQMMRGIEADDALTIVSEWYKDDPEVTTVIATKDKDLWQYPGHHYNMNENELMFITEEQAHKNLWRQMMLGDMSVDNVPGLSHAAKFEIRFRDEDHKRKFRPIPCQSFGKVRVEKLLDEWAPEDYAKNVLELYIDQYELDDDDFGEYRYYETFDLIWMLRELPEGVEIKREMYKVKLPQVEYETLAFGSNEFEDI